MALGRLQFRWHCGNLRRRSEDVIRSKRRQVRYRIARSQAGFLTAAVAKPGRRCGRSGWKDWAAAQKQLKPLTAGLRKFGIYLRPYQKECVYWLFSSSDRIGGILADEMGLGNDSADFGYLRTAKAPSRVVAHFAAFNGGGKPSVLLGAESVSDRWIGRVLGLIRFPSTMLV